ncbi:MAG TPA: hypothetical protein VIL91_10960, partial [Gaiellaceae bacterium]
VDVGTNSSSYLLVAGDVGSTVRVVVTASNGAGSQGATSAQTGVVAAASTSTVTTVSFSVAASGDDGYAFSKGAAYPPAAAPDANTTGPTVTMARRLTPNGYDVYAGLLRFDTSAIPDDATVTGVTFRAQVMGKVSADGRNLVGEWYDPAGWPIDAGDYALNSSATALAAMSIAQIVAGAQNDFPLAAPASLSKTGLSALRLFVDGGQPTGDNYVQFASYDHATLTEPQLVVTYTR